MLKNQLQPVQLLKMNEPRVLIKHHLVDWFFFEAVSKITTDVNKGIVVTTLGYWRQLNNGVVNSVSSNAFGDMGNSPTSHDCLVEVQLA